MKLEDVCLLSENFYEEEEAALCELPRDADGLRQLLDYISCNEGSFSAWMVLLQDFDFLMTEEQLTELRKRAEKIWVQETVTELINEE